MLEQERTRFVTERFDRQRGAVFESARGADRMHAGDVAAEMLERRSLLEFGRAAAVACKDRKAESLEAMQCAAVDGHRRDRGYLVRIERFDERVLFEYC